MDFTHSFTDTLLENIGAVNFAQHGAFKICWTDEWDVMRWKKANKQEQPWVILRLEILKFPALVSVTPHYSTAVWHSSNCAAPLCVSCPRLYAFHTAAQLPFYNKSPQLWQDATELITPIWNGWCMPLIILISARDCLYYYKINSTPKKNGYTQYPGNNIE